MDLNEAYQILIETGNEIKEKALEECGILHEHIRYGIVFLHEGLGYVDNVEIDLGNHHRFVSIKYLNTVPLRSYWILEMISTGNYSSGLGLLRIMLEDIVSMFYFLDNREIAIQAIENDNYNEPGFRRKINKLGGETGELFREMHKMLSELFVHSSLKKWVGLVEGNTLQPEPFFDKTNMCDGLAFLLTFLPISLKVLIEAFPDEVNVGKYVNTVEKYVKSSEEIISEAE